MNILRVKRFLEIKPWRIFQAVLGQYFHYAQRSLDTSTYTGENDGVSGCLKVKRGKKGKPRIILTLGGGVGGEGAAASWDGGGIGNGAVAETVTLCCPYWWYQQYATPLAI